MKILRKDTISDVQSRFSEEYPLLKLKFYSKEHGHLEGTPKKDEVDNTMSLIQLNPNLVDGDIPILSSVSVDQLETSFERDYGLHVQVFRKSGEQWLQTSTTDFWTLAQHVESATRSELAHK